VRNLQARSKARLRQKAFVVEGPNILQEAVETNAHLDEVYYTSSIAETIEGKNLLDALSNRSDAVIPVSNEVMQAMSDTQTPQGILGVSVIPEIPFPGTLNFVLVIDGLADPGNLGTIMRTATGAGVQLMVVTPGTVDVTNPKVVRSAAGSHFRLPVRLLDWNEIPALLENTNILLAETSHEAANYYEVDLTQPCTLIVSEEAHGASQDAREMASSYVTIPMPVNIDSLNVAVAAGILLFEVVRQRRVIKP